MKKLKLLATLLSVLMLLSTLAACSSKNASSNVDGKKYDSIVAVYGDVTLARDGDSMRLFVNGKKKGEKVDYIEALFAESNVPTGFYKVIPKGGTRYAIMDSKGKIKTPAIYDDIKINAFVNNFDVKASTKMLGFEGKKIDTATNETTYTLINANFEEKEVFDSAITFKGNIVIGSRILGTDTEYLAYSASGEFLARSTDLSILDVLQNTQTSSAILFFTSSIFYPGAASPIPVDSRPTLFADRKSYIYEQDGKIFRLKSDYTTEAMSDDYYSAYTHDYFDTLYTVENGSDGLRIKTPDGTATGYYDSLALSYFSDDYFILKEKGDVDKYTVMLQDTTVIASGIQAANASNIDFVIFEPYSKYGLFTLEDKKLTYNFSGATKSYTLLENESLYSWESKYGYAIIYNSSEGKYYLWTGVAGAKVALSSYTIKNGNCFDFVVPLTGGDAIYATPLQNIKFWDGDVNKDNLYNLTATAPIVDYDTKNITSVLYDDFLISKGVDANNRSTTLNAMIASYMTVAYITTSLTIDGETKATEYFACNANEYDKAIIAPFENTEKIDVSLPYAVRLDKDNKLTIYNFYKQNGELKYGSKTIASPLTTAVSIYTDTLLNHYIITTVKGTNGVYDTNGNVLLHPGRFTINSVSNRYQIENGNAVVNSPYASTSKGVIELKNKGKIKVLHDLTANAFSLYADGSFVATMNSSDRFKTLYNQKGKAVEKQCNVAPVAISDLIYYYNNLADKKLVTKEIVLLPDGRAKIMTITIPEAAMNYSIYNLIANLNP